MEERAPQKQMKPLVKWVGGKGQLVDEISSMYPSTLGTKIVKYAEPFVGGGAVLFDILNKYQLTEIYISDTNRELIDTYCQVRDNVEALISLLSQWENEYIFANEEQRKKIYYEKRERFNELIKNNDNGYEEKAALFIFMNHSCFNGLYRVNKRGEYNVPIGAYKKPLICDSENLRSVSEGLANVVIVCADYRESRGFIDEQTFVYLDPPYRPLNKTSSFVSYTVANFDDQEQQNLARYVQELTLANVPVLVSNSDPKNVDETDNFFESLYNRQNIKRVFANRSVNSVGNARGKISELLISNYEISNLKEM